MNEITQEKFCSYPFYSLNEFTELQPFSRNKNNLYLYQHNQSRELMIVKEVPITPWSEQVYKILMKKQAFEGLVKIRGISLRKVHKKRNKKYSRVKGQFQVSLAMDHAESQKKNQNKLSDNCSLLIFMEKCQHNLLTFVGNRLKQRKPFSLSEITDFLSQMLIILCSLEEDNLSHRDIKPENILYDHGRWRLCDFDDALYIDQRTIEQRTELDITTLAYVSPSFYKNLKEGKNKIFDPFKLDVYALGLTLLFMCSLGKFDLKKRVDVLTSPIIHNTFLKQQRRKYIKNNPELKPLNSTVKMMLEEDEYKRDTFLTLIQKTKSMINVKSNLHLVQGFQQEEKVSENSRSEQSLQHLKKVRQRRKNKWRGTTELQRKSIKSLLIFSISFFILLFIL